VSESFLETTIPIKDRKIMVAIPSFDGKILVDTMRSLFEFQRALNQYGAGFGIISVCGNSLITEARNELVNDFLHKAEGGTDLFFLDADIVFDVKDALRLVMWGSKVDIVSGVYPRKKLGENGYPEFDCAPVPDVDGNFIMQEDGYLFRATGCGIGFTNVRRHVIEKMIEDNKDDFYYHRKGGERVRLFDTNLMDNHILCGEDFYFFRLAEKSGFTQWVDPYCQLKHVGQVEYEGSLMDSLNRAEEAFRKENDSAA
jgi:hypothetical protein